jgi:phosphopantetheinyl transferase
LQNPPLCARRIPFGLSHTERAFVLGLTLGRDVGVGLEVVRQLDDRGHIAESQFAPEEVLRLKSIPRREIILEFCGLWGRHEAIFRSPHPHPQPALTTLFESALTLKGNLTVGWREVGR